MTPEQLPPRHVPRPIDPDSPAGKRASAELGELFDDVIERLRRERKPIPAALLGLTEPDRSTA
jgi:hypothetical protein